VTQEFALGRARPLHSGRGFVFIRAKLQKINGGICLKKVITKPPGGALKRRKAGKALYITFVAFMLLLMFAQPVAAAEPPPAGGTTVWTKANEIMKDVYNQILLISTIAAIVTASIALLMMNFSKSGKTVDESRAWLKRIVITWAILNGLGFIMSYVTPFFADGRWNG
jgi:hypothetical protein